MHKDGFLLLVRNCAVGMQRLTLLLLVTAPFATAPLPRLRGGRATSETLAGAGAAGTDNLRGRSLFFHFLPPPSAPQPPSPSTAATT